MTGPEAAHEFIRARLADREAAAIPVSHIDPLRAPWLCTMPTRGRGICGWRLDVTGIPPHVAAAKARAEHDRTHAYPAELALIGALRAVADMHAPRVDDGMMYDDRKGQVSCGHCESLCHSHSGLACETDGDAPYPCDTIRRLAASWAGHPDYRQEWAA